MRYPALVRVAWLACCIGSIACVGPPPAPPTAVVDLTPSSVCAGDAFATAIAISGARSASRLSLVPTAPEPGELTYAWQLDGAEHWIESGALNAPDLVVRMAGDRPLHVSLTVTTADGGEAQTLRTIGITSEIALPCADGCPSDHDCVEREGESVCLPIATCASDGDCTGCFACDPALSRCVPRETL